MREGGDLLLVGPDGTTVLIQGYFDLADPPALSSEGGAVLAADLVARLAGPLAPGQYVAAGDGIDELPIGRVEESIGEATATRIDGTTVSLEKDAEVFQGDIIETDAGGAVAITFIDETTFSLGEDARMVIDELIFDPASQEGSSAFSVVEGVFVFVSGDIAANDPEAMLVKTPVATLGIRGTKVAGYAAQEGEENKVVLLSEGDGEVGEVLVSNPSGQVVLSQANETTIITSVFFGPEDSFISSDEEIFSLVAQASKVLPANLKIADPQEGRREDGDDGGDGQGGEQGAEGEEGEGEEELIENTLEGEEGEGEEEELAEEELEGEEEEGEGEEEELAEEAAEEEGEAEEEAAEEEGEVTEEEIAALAEVAPAAGGDVAADAGDVGDVGGDVGDVGGDIGGDFGGDPLGDLGGDFGDLTATTDFDVFTSADVTGDADVGGDVGGDTGGTETTTGGGGEEDEVVIVVDPEPEPEPPINVPIEVAGNFYIGSGEIPVNQNYDGDQEDADVAGLSGGNIAVVWEDQTNQDGDNNGIFGRVLGSDGAPIGDEFQVNTVTASNQSDPQVAALSDGGFVTVWESYGQDGDGFGVFGQRFDADGDPVGTEFAVNTYTTYSQDDPAVAALGDGGFVVAWESSYQDGNGEGVFAQRFDVSGTTPLALGNEFQVNSEIYGDQSDPSVAGLSDGGFVIAWESNYQDGDDDGIFSQRFDVYGDTAGSEFQVNTETAYNQSDPSIAALNDGGFVAVWESRYQEGTYGDGTYQGIYGQRFNAAGSAVGSEFHVNSETENNQDDPDVTTLGDGSFIVVWESNDQDGDGDGIFAQQFGTTGTTPTPIGSEFQVNTKSAGNQRDEAVVDLSDGGFAVSWETDGTRTREFNEDVRVQIFDSGANPSPGATRSPLTLYGGYGDDLLVGGTNNDVLNGGADNDVLDGFLGDDILIGGDGDDALFGDSGNDTLDGGLGDDIIYGGEGVSIDGGEGDDPDIDTVTFSGATTGISVNLDSRFAYDGAGGYDTVNGIENVIGTEFADFIYGNYDDNTLIGGDGDDGLYGGYGGDLIEGGLGNDQVDGGDGADHLLGGYGDDELLGRYDNDTLDGGFGNDTLIGSYGDDTLLGGDGDDTLFGGYDSDLLSGGPGDDFIDGGYASSNNTVTFETSATPVTVDLDAGTASGEGNDTLQNIGNAIGSGFNDILAGTSAGNDIDGGGGDDLISGLDGSDTLSGGAGNDTLLGGDGEDTLSGGLGDDFIDGGFDGGEGNFNLLTFETSATAVTVDLAAGTASGEGSDVIQNVGHVIGSDGNDVLIGGEFSPGESGNTLDGGFGDDTITGSGGSDTLIGADGGDVLSGGSGNDDLDGGVGDDVLSGGDGDDDFFVGGSLTLEEEEGNDSIATANVIARSDFAIDENFDVADDSIPHVAISGFIGGEQASGGADDVDFFRFDLLAGETITLDIDFADGGFDNFDSALQLFDSSDERVAFDDDSSTFDGGEGSDSESDSFLTFTAPASGAFFAAVSSFPNFFTDPSQPSSGEDGGDYVLNVSIEGLVPSSDGNDVFDGGDGIDSIDFGSFQGSNGVTVDLSNTGTQTVSVEFGTDTFLNIENISGTDNADSLTGNDIAEFVGYQFDISGDLNAPTFDLTNTSDAAEITSLNFTIGDTTSNFDAVLNEVTGGISFTLNTPDAVNNLLDSDNINIDFTSGFNPAAVFQFDADVDFDATSDLSDFTSVFFNNSAAPNSVISVSFSDGSVLSQTLPESPTIGPGNLVSFSQSEAVAGDILQGNDGSDTLSGLAGNDFLIGGSDNDVLIGGAGQDTLDGGSGNDIFRFLDPSDGATALDGSPVGQTTGDFINDFSSGSDKIQLEGSTFGFGSFTGALTLGSNFFSVENFDGTNASGAPSSGAYVVFDPISNTLYADDTSLTNSSYTVVATFEQGTPVAANVEII